MANLLRWILFIYFSVLVVNISGKSVKICKILNIELCDTSANSAVKIKDIRFHNPDKANSVIYMEADVIRDLVEEPGLQIVVIKCKNRENPDLCEKFSTLKPSRPCMFMFMKGMMWTNFVENIVPRAECQIKKGYYTMKNATLDPELFNIFPINGYVWKIELKFSEGAEYLTICVMAQIISVNV